MSPLIMNVVQKEEEEEFPSIFGNPLNLNSFCKTSWTLIHEHGKIPSSPFLIFFFHSFWRITRFLQIMLLEWIRLYTCYVISSRQ